jgi:hypothetical protein
MTDRPAFREFGKIAEKWRALAERRRTDFADLCRSGRWQLYYEEHELRTRMREVVTICGRWTTVVEQHRQALSELAAPVIDREAA